MAALPDASICLCLVQCNTNTLETFVSAPDTRPPGPARCGIFHLLALVFSRISTSAPEFRQSRPQAYSVARSLASPPAMARCHATSKHRSAALACGAQSLALQPPGSLFLTCRHSCKPTNRPRCRSTLSGLTALTPVFGLLALHLLPTREDQLAREKATDTREPIPRYMETRKGCEKRTKSVDHHPVRRLRAESLLGPIS